MFDVNSSDDFPPAMHPIFADEKTQLMRSEPRTGTQMKLISHFEVRMSTTMDRSAHKYSFS
jgi:hypothetical protein